MSILERYRVKFKESYIPPIKGPKLSSEDFEAFQANSGIRLPKQFQEFYSFLNGARPDEQYYRLRTEFRHEPESTPECLSVDNFMILTPETPPYGGYAVYILPGFYPGDAAERYIERDDPLLEGWNPQKCLEYLTFGKANNHRAYLLIGIVEKNFGQIFFWHEDEDEMGNPHFLENSLFDFLEEMGDYNHVMR